MGLENTSISTVPHSEDLSTAIEIIEARPPSGFLNNLQNPGRLIGYLDPMSGSVQLYIASPSGNKWLPISVKI